MIGLLLLGTGVDRAVYLLRMHARPGCQNDDLFVWLCTAVAGSPHQVCVHILSCVGCACWMCERHSRIVSFRRKPCVCMERMRGWESTSSVHAHAQGPIDSLQSSRFALFSGCVVISLMRFVVAG
jgi:hypothetical protein